jgi:hypothetical protein
MLMGSETGAMMNEEARNVEKQKYNCWMGICGMLVLRSLMPCWLIGNGVFANILTILSP